VSASGEVTIAGREPRPSGSEWTERYRESMMNTFGEPQRVLVRGQGCHVWDADGNRYLDLLAGIAVNSLGHAHPAILSAVTDQLQRLGHVSNFFASGPQVELAEKLLELLGVQGSGRVFFANSGTEANEAAFKATRLTGRKTIIAAEGSFHGRTMGALALTSKEQYRTPFEPLPTEVRWVKFGDSQALAEAVDETVAAVILEPIQGEAGVIVPPANYLADARRITREHGALLWLDEVQTGMGRTGKWFGHSETGVVPDLVTLAKGLGGGIPIGACIGIGAAATLLGPGNHGTTFGGNPVSMAAGLAVISTIESEGLLNATSVRGDQIADGLLANNWVNEVTGAGLLRGIVLAEPRAVEIQQAALAAGLILNAPTADRLRIAPPLVLSEDEAANAVKTLSTVIDEVMK